MAIENRIRLKTRTKKFETLFDYTFQEGQKLNLLNINIIQSKYGISIDQTDLSIKNIIQEYWVTKTKDEVRYWQSPVTVYTSFENTLFTYTPLIGEEMKNEK